MSRDAPSKPPIKAWRNNFVPAESVLTSVKSIEKNLKIVLKKFIKTNNK